MQESRAQKRHVRAARTRGAPGDPAFAAVVRRLTDAVLALPQRYREVVVRHWLARETLPSIAADLGLPLATVRSRLQRGFSLLGADGGAAGLGAATMTFGLPGLAPGGATSGVFTLRMGWKTMLATNSAVALCAPSGSAVHGRAIRLAPGSRPATAAALLAGGAPTGVEDGGHHRPVVDAGGGTFWDWPAPA